MNAYIRLMFGLGWVRLTNLLNHSERTKRSTLRNCGFRSIINSYPQDSNENKFYYCFVPYLFQVAAQRVKD